MNTDLLTDKLGTIVESLYGWAPKLVGAIIVFLIGLWIISALTKYIRKALERSSVDNDIVPFLSSVISVILKILLIFSVAGIIGIETTSFIALIGMAGLAIGMALQGTLGHLASGLMIMIFKPYRVGDLVSVQDQLGHVDEVQIFNTIITTLDNKKVIIPNGVATSGIITNLSTNEFLRVDLNIAMPYEEDFDKIQPIVMGALKATSKARTEPDPYVEIEKFDEHNVLLCARTHANTEDYWDVYFEAYKNVKAALGSHGIKVAYPKREIHMMNNQA
jgi:small conductance mechanosensitive channel